MDIGTPIICSILQHTATHCSTLNTLQHTNTGGLAVRDIGTPIICHLLQLTATATHCNTLQHINTGGMAVEDISLHGTTLQPLGRWVHCLDFRTCSNVSTYSTHLYIYMCSAHVHMYMCMCVQHMSR